MNLYEQLLATAEQADLKIVSDDKCCRLLAWLYAYGGGNEAVTMNMKLNRDILTAQKRLNLFGGEKVNKELLPKLQEYIKQVEPIVQLKSKEHPQWVYDICDYYGLSKTLA